MYDPMARRDELVHGECGGHRVQGQGRQPTTTYGDAPDFTGLNGRVIDALEQVA